MNLALERYADNPIVDELVCWPPKSKKMKSIRACNVLFRKPFIEVEMADGEIFQRHFPRESFARFWAEACVILETLTTIELRSDFGFNSVAEPEKLVQRVLADRAECIEECEQMFAEGMYEQFLMQYGEDCKNLPFDTLQNIEQARREIASSK